MAQDPPHRLGPLAVRVDSVGGLETSIDLPEWRLCVDLGRCPPHLLPRPLVLFTHAHMDHLGGVAYHCATRSLLGMSHPTYVVPPPVAEPLGQLFESWRALDQSTLPHGILPLGPGQELEIRKDLVVRPFKTLHTVPSQGYAFFSKKRRLKPEYQGLPEGELRRLAVQERRELTAPSETLELAITGDTLPDVISEQPWVRTAPVLILECTFLDQRVSVEKARSTGHTHLLELLRYADQLENQVLGLMHFSARYSRSEVERLLDKHLPAELRARTVALHPGRGPELPEESLEQLET